MNCMNAYTFKPSSWLNSAEKSDRKNVGSWGPYDANASKHTSYTIENHFCCKLIDFIMKCVRSE